ncbi:MAG: hypothetical protein ACJ8LM_03890 [Candidatus Udaeobacter sp.]
MARSVGLVFAGAIVAVLVFWTASLIHAPVALPFAWVCPYWLFVTFFLSASGAIGGLAWHLVNNDGYVIFPTVREVPEAEKVAGTKDRGWKMGVWSDVLIGLIAANSIHLAIAGMVDYQGAVTDPQKQARINFSLIALGILSGFAGATLLESLSKQLKKALLTPEQEKRLGKEVANSSPVREAIHEQFFQVVDIAEGLSQAGAALNAPVGNAATLPGCEAAIRTLQAAFNAFPHIRILAIYLGRLHRKIAEITSNDAEFDEAIRVLANSLQSRRDANIKKGKDDADILYNRSCYRTILGTRRLAQKDELFDSAWQDLKESVAVSPPNLDEALKDDDLAPLREVQDFESLRKPI